MQERKIVEHMLCTSFGKIKYCVGNIKRLNLVAFLLLIKLFLNHYASVNFKKRCHAAFLHHVLILYEYHQALRKQPIKKR